MQESIDLTVSYMINTTPDLFKIDFGVAWPEFSSMILSSNPKKVAAISFYPNISPTKYKYLFEDSKEHSSVWLRFNFLCNISQGTILRIHFENPSIPTSAYQIQNKTISLEMLGFKNCPAFGYIYDMSILFSIC